MRKQVLLLVPLICGLLNASPLKLPRIAAGINSDSCLEVFFIDADNKLYHKWQTICGQKWSDQELVTDSVKGIFMSSNASGALEVFYIDLVNRLYNFRQNTPGSGWTEKKEFAPNTSWVSLIQDTANRLNIFYIQGDNSLISRYQTSAGDNWTEKNQLIDYAKVAAVGRNEDGRLELFYTILGDTLYHKWQLAPNGAWSEGYYFSEPSKTLTVSQNGDGRLEVFFIDCSDTLHHKWQVAANGGWADGAVFANAARVISVGKNQDQRMEVLFTGNDNILYHNWQIAPSGGWGSGKQFGWTASDVAIEKNQDGRLEVFYLGMDSVLYHNWQLDPGIFWAGEYPFISDSNALFSFDDYDTVPNYCPSQDQWHVNDHCFIQADDGKWHMFGIVAPNPDHYDTTIINYFGHASADYLLQQPWNELDPPFYESLDGGKVLWAPHIIRHENLFYMFYCGGGNLNAYEICLRTSSDLINWSNAQVLFYDGYQGRDPMIIWLEEKQQWILYYCATEYPDGGHHVVAYRTSQDLIHWSNRYIAYNDFHIGTGYGPTESPFVVRRGDYFYLFIGPRPYDAPTETLPNWKHPGYVGTDVFRSKQWNHWTNANFAGHVDAHAMEIIQDSSGDWYASHCGIKQGGLFLRRMYWHDSINTGISAKEKNYSAIKLAQNFPNPFNSQTTIHLIMDKRERVLIEIIDITGKKIKILTDEEKSAGKYNLTWDATNFSGKPVPEGVYLCRIRTKDNQSVIKMVRLR